MSNDTILQKPPRLLAAEPGPYDWREFDRWIRRVYDLLAVRSDSQSYSVVSDIESIRTASFLTSSTISSIREDVNDPITVAYSMGGQTASSTPDESYLTLYWMGV